MHARVPLVSCFLLTLGPVLLTSAYDAYSACSKPFRTSKLYAEPPCDFRLQPWCTVPGSAYPWQAVRRFVRENQGLMRRMYGEERHISVLRAEIESNDVEYLTETEWKLREQVRLRYSSRIPAQPVVQSTTKETTTSTATTTEKKTSERTTATVPITTWRRTPESTPATTITTSQPANSTQIPKYVLELRNITPNSSISDDPEDEPNTTASDDAPANTTLNSSILTTTDPTFSTMQVETTMNEDRIGSDTTEMEEDLSTTEETTENAKVTEEMTTIKEQELFQAAVREPVVNKSPPLLKLKGVNACPVKEEVVAPFWANNTRGEILALLNVYPFEQYVHWEKCTYENKQMFCRNGCRCEQQYRLHRLLAYDPSNECRGIFSDWFKFPSCCVCRCYDLPIEFHITSRSPRVRNNEPPYWYKLKPYGK